MTKFRQRAQIVLLIAVLLLLPFGLTACSQFSKGTVSLTLIDEETGGRKAYVSVRLEPLGDNDNNARQQSVDDNGVVIFKDVPPGKWRLEILNAQDEVLENSLGTFEMRAGRTVSEDVEVGDSIGEAQNGASGGAGRFGQ